MTFHAPQVAFELQGAVGLPARPGLLVESVVPGGPAARAGLQRGDLVVAGPGGDYPSVASLSASAAAAAADAPMELTVLRGLDELRIVVTG